MEENILQSGFNTGRVVHESAPRQIRTQHWLCTMPSVENGRSRNMHPPEVLKDCAGILTVAGLPTAFLHGACRGLRNKIERLQQVRQGQHIQADCFVERW